MRARIGLARWNRSLLTGDVRDRADAITQARWLLMKEVELAGGGGGWVHPQANPGYFAYRPWISAATQASAISLLVRAYQTTGDSTYLDAAGRAAATFTREVVDCGVTAPAGSSGTVFEEVAVYPAAHILRGFLESFIGLYDYLAFRDDPRIVRVLEDAHETLHELLPHFDAGGWTRVDLLRNQLASPDRQREHATLLAVVARFAGCAECARRAERWRSALRRPIRRAGVAFARRAAGGRAGMGAALRRLRYPGSVAAARTGPATPLPVCVPITAYPLPGGMRAVMRAWEQVMAGVWSMGFFTRVIGPERQGEDVTSFELRWRPFGRETSSPHQFPNVLFYLFAGARGLRKQLRRRPDTRLLLPQDGVFSAAFAGRIGRRAGVRVVSMDHGNVHALYDPAWYPEEVGRLRRFGRLKRTVAYLRLRVYWPTLRLLLRMAVRRTDAFLVASDQIAEDYQRHLRVPAYKISRVPWVVDAERLAPLAGAGRAAARQRFGVPADAVLISMVNRLGPEKGMHVALPALGQMYTALPEALRSRVRVVIAGDGPSRAQVEADVGQLGLGGSVLLWGTATPDEVAALLGASDIFLYTGVRDTNPMALVEAMAAGCASVGTTSTPHVAMNYADGRGIAVPVGDADAIAAALTELVRDDARRISMGTLAREYVLTHHTAEMARKALLRVSFYEPPLLARPAVIDAAGEVRQVETTPARGGTTQEGSER